MASDVRIIKIHKVLVVLCAILLLQLIIAFVMINCARIPIVSWLFLVIFFAVIALALCLVIVAIVTLRNLIKEMHDFADEHQQQCPQERHRFDIKCKIIGIILLMTLIGCGGLLWSGWVDINWATGINIALIVFAVALIFYLIQLKKDIQMYINCVQIISQTAFVCSDPHATWDGHLDGAFSEGDQIEDFLNSHNYSVTVKKHPVSKSEFLADTENKTIVHLAGHGSHSGGQVYFCFDDEDVYPNDISALNSVPTELFYAGVCLGGVNSTMADTFINKGTKNYIGFTRSIPDWDAKYFGDLFYEKWKDEGKDIETALDEADDDYPGLNCWVVWGD